MFVLHNFIAKFYNQRCVEYKSRDFISDHVFCPFVDALIFLTNYRDTSHKYFLFGYNEVRRC